MFKTLKDTRRRMTEKALEKVGKSERTTDPDYEVHVEKFRAMAGDMNECGAALHSFLTHQKALFSDAEELSKSLARIYEQSQACTDWPDVQCQLQRKDEADMYVQRVGAIHNVLRSSISTVSVEQALDPFREAVTRMVPDIEQLCKEREKLLTDYDSYKRRLKALEQKKEYLISQGKEGTPPAEANQAEIAKFSNKEQVGLEGFVFHNEKVKTDIIKAKTIHDGLMDSLLITTIVCQAELFSLAASQLEDIVDRLPESKVNEVRNAIYGYIQKGGIQPPAPKEKSKLQKGIAIITGKSVPSDFNGSRAAAPVQRQQSKTNTYAAVKASSSSDPFAADGNPFVSESVNSNENPFGESPSASAVPSPPPAPPGAPPSAPPPPPVATAVSAENPFGDDTAGNPFGTNNSSDMAFSESVPTAAAAASHLPTATPAAATDQVFVEALYDNEAEDEDELSFQVGNLIEVLDMADGGWWRGRLNGSEGLFPVNYVKTMTG